MKTIYTDQLGLYPWVLVFLSTMSFWGAYDSLTGNRRAPFGLDRTVGGVFFAIAGGYWLFLAAKRFRNVQLARREGRDPTIVRIKE